MTTMADRADMSVAALGTGIMGSAMVRNLVAAGLPTTCWDRSAEALAPLAQAGARPATSVAEAVRDAGVVITMLPTAEAVRSVVLDDGAAEARRERYGHDRHDGDSRARRAARPAAA
jgi:3-hydroxyisobutyrate dehydrogenase-like beta-hydroxyacid dehydrogenase